MEPAAIQAHMNAAFCLSALPLLPNHASESATQLWILPTWAHKTFYSCYIFPYMDYCIPVWGASSELSRLLKLQKQAARLILNCDFNTPSQEMFKSLKWMPLQDWAKFRRAKLVYKCRNNIAPGYLCEMFQTVNEVHTVKTRQSANNDMFLPPRAKLNAFRSSFRYSGAQIWNTIPIYIREAPSISVFTNSYMSYYHKD